MPNLGQMHRSASWSGQLQYGQSVPATRQTEFSMLWGAPRTNVTGHLPFYHQQAYPGVHGGLPYPGTHFGGNCIRPNELNALSTEVAASSPQHWWEERPFDTPPNGTGVMLEPPNHQVSMTVVNTIGDLVATPPASAATPSPPVVSAPAARQMSKTRTGRNGPRRGLPGQTFEPNVEKVQRRLRSEGADAGAVACLHSEIFLDGTIAMRALKAPMSLAQRRGREAGGTQKYMLLVKVVPRSQKEVDHQCLLCPSRARAEFKNREDSLRHLYKDHFGLSFDCEDWCVDFQSNGIAADLCISGHKFWLEKELAKHAKAKHGQS
jgi:hypothetical protein